jgi:hypothetical protein
MAAAAMLRRDRAADETSTRKRGDSVKAHYSLIQFCPDRRRDERLNVGLVVLTGDGRLNARSSFRAAMRASFVFRLRNLMPSIEATVHRLSIAKDLKTVDQLTVFAVSRANDIRMTVPRLCKIDDLDADFDRMFFELVEWKGE